MKKEAGMGILSGEGKSGGWLIKKDDFLFLVVFGLWMLALLYFNPRLIILTLGPENVIAKIAVVLFIICLDIFWFYTIFHLTILTFSYFSPKAPEERKNPALPYPETAVLYVTYNDFREEAVLSCVNQDYPGVHVFILDDSTNQTYIKAIDEFALRHGKTVSVIRRENRTGFKAGNLNHALSLLSDDYDYFAVCDADGIIPPDFISRLLPYFSRQEKVGFVQALNKINPSQNSYLAETMSFNLELHYRRYIMPRQKYGFVMFHGHGALISVKAWKESGGFPEIVSEDLGFSTRLRKHGYFGVLAKDCVCYEDYPATYRHYRRRAEKWVKGTLEFLFREYPDFFRAKNISWFEKADVFASGLSLALGFPFLLFLLAGGLILPFYFANFNSSAPVFIPAIPEGKTTVSLLAGLRYNTYWTMDFYLIMLVTIFYPLVPVFIDLAKKPARMFRYMCISTCLFLSTLVWISYISLAYLLTRKNDFLVTAHEVSAQPEGILLRIRRIGAKQRIILLAEFFFAAVFVVIMSRSNNLWLLSVAWALFLSPLMFIFDCNCRIMRWLAAFPFIISVFVLILISKSIVR